MEMLNFKKIAANVPVANLILETSWYKDISIRQEFAGSAHKDTETVYLVGPKDFAKYQTFDKNNITLFDRFKELTKEQVSALLNAFSYVASEELFYVLSVKLKPYGKVTPHTDEGSYAENTLRYHLVVDAPEEGVTFTCGDETVEMKTGEIWWFNHQIEHSVTSTSDQHRTHIIFDVLKS